MEKDESNSGAAGDASAGDAHPSDELDLVGLSQFIQSDSVSRDQLLSQGIYLVQSQLCDPELDRETKTKWQKSLVEFLCEHNENTNEFEALEQALEYLCELADDIDEDDWPQTTWVHYWQSRCLRNRYMRSANNPLDLENAIASAEYSYEHTQRLQGPDLSKIKYERNEQLWWCLFTEAQDSDHVLEEKINRVVELALASLASSISEHLGNGERHIKAVSNLGMSYQLRWDKLQDSPQDLVRAVELGYDVVKLLPSEGQEDARMIATSNLAFRLQRAYPLCLKDVQLQEMLKVTGPDQILNEAFSYIGESTLICGSQLMSRATNTFAFVSGIEEFASCKEDACSMLGRCYDMLRHSVEDLEELLATAAPTDLRDGVGKFYGIARYCAAAGLQAGVDPSEVLAFMESGRSFQRSVRFQHDNTTEVIGDGHSNIVIRYEEAKDKLASLTARNAPFYQRKAASDSLRSVRKELDVASGLITDTGILSKAALMVLAEDCDIVVVNITDIRSDAILISKSRGIMSVLLPDLIEKDLSAMCWEIQTRLAKETNQEETYAELQGQLRALLRCLWRQLVKPVLKELNCDKVQLPSAPDSWPHIRWVPTGILNLYPIHAAGLGLHTTNNTINRVISTYAPDLTSLWASRARREVHPLRRKDSNQAESIGAKMKIGIVSMEETPGRQLLDFSKKEADAITLCFDHFEVIEQPTTTGVLTFMTDHNPLLHFSCHGEVDYDFPFESKLLTTDWEINPLTVDRLQSLKLHGSEMAFLSACFTANAGVEYLQDETTHLALALQNAGFRSVVGSLWYVGQEAAFDMAVSFYQQLRNRYSISGKVIAECLHFATLSNAEKTRTPANKMQGDPVTWTPFLHFG